MQGLNFTMLYCTTASLPGSKCLMHFKGQYTLQTSEHTVRTQRQKRQSAGRMRGKEDKTRMNQSSLQGKGARQGICKMFQQAGEVVALMNSILPLCQH